jgi:hypothetical protein
MDVVSRCPLPVGSVIWQPRAGAFVLTVICKATYRLFPIESPLAEDQEDLNEADRYWDGEERSSLSAASDNVPFKRWADVTLVGHAYAPARQPVSSLIARLAVGELSKAIEVHGDRAWTVDGRLREGEPFVSMPLWWERAAGGPGTLNPVGIRANARPSERSHREIPNLQPRGLHPTSPSEVIPPVCFGPIAPTWPQRAAKLNNSSPFWDYRTWSQRPLPEDVEAAFFNAAPMDQQVERLLGTERIALENLLPDHPRFVTKLGHVAPRARLQRAGAGEEDLRLRCDTLSIDTDRGICTLVWRGAVPLDQHASEKGRIVVTAEGEAVRPQRDGAAETVVVGFSGGSNASIKPVLPFVEGSSQIGRTPEINTDGRSGRPVPARPPDDSATITAPLSPMKPGGDPLPFLKPTPAVLEGRLAPPELPTTPAAPSMDPVSIQPEPSLDPSAFPIERFATIAAEIAERRASRAETLKAHELTERDWTSLERYFADALEKETARGSQKLQGASDHAYVAAVESFRGPILITEYARIVVGMERRQANEVLDELKIQRPARMRILRLWTKKIAADAKLARNVMDLLSKVRAT